MGDCNSTALHAAAKGGILNIVFENGAHINAGEHSGGAALHTAIESGNPSIVRYLFEKVADANAGEAFSEHVYAGWYRGIFRGWTTRAWAGATNELTHLSDRIEIPWRRFGVHHHQKSEKQFISQ